MKANKTTKQPTELIAGLNKLLNAGNFLPGKAPQVTKIVEVIGQGDLMVRFQFWNGKSGKGRMIASGGYWTVCYGNITFQVAA